MKTAISLLLLLFLAGICSAQTDRDAINHYEGHFEKYLGKEIRLMVAEATRRDKGEYGNIAVFSIYTKGLKNTGYTTAAVPISEAHAFASRYSLDDYKTKPLRGVFRSTADQTFYISFNGATFPNDDTFAKSVMAGRPKGTAATNAPSFDDSPMNSFSYNGTRLVEARITEITPSVVRVADKHNTLIEVPLYRAVTMPDLRMRARDAMEAALMAKAAAADKAHSAPAE